MNKYYFESLLMKIKFAEFHNIHIDNVVDQSSVINGDQEFWLILDTDMDYSKSSYVIETQVETERWNF